MRIAIVGAGGVGGFLAGLLARAGRDEVVLVARGATLEAVRAGGLAVDSPLGAFTARPALVTDDPAAAGPCDAVLVAVKSWQVAALAPTLAPLLAGGGVAVPLQNGVEAAARLAASLPPAQVAGGYCLMFAWAEAPGRIKHAGTPPRVICGDRPGTALRPRLEALAGALQAAGIGAEVSGDIEAGTWEKLLFVEPLGALGAASRAPALPMRRTPETRALLAGLLAETVAVARARGVVLDPALVERTLAKVDAVPPASTVSMHRDLAAGRPSELEDQTGAVVRLGREAGVPVPLHAALLAALLPLERAARGEAEGFART
ncbi:MAG TPA: 2-dehydropantoate 2-reductase [Anaeromyxobacteraceae bacterium]|nr:2-dehydropantoate 2-reductase [Anaeromyxobacteraceae bacterium]